MQGKQETTFLKRRRPFHCEQAFVRQATPLTTTARTSTPILDENNFQRAHPILALDLGEPVASMLQ